MKASRNVAHEMHECFQNYATFGSLHAESFRTKVRAVDCKMPSSKARACTDTTDNGFARHNAFLVKIVVLIEATTRPLVADKAIDFHPAAGFVGYCEQCQASFTKPR